MHTLVTVLMCSMLWPCPLMVEAGMIGGELKGQTKAALRMRNLKRLQLNLPAVPGRGQSGLGPRLGYTATGAGGAIAAVRAGQRTGGRDRRRGR